MTTKKLLICMFLCLTIFFSGCDLLPSASSSEDIPPPPPDYPVEVGYVSISEKPECIVSLTPQVTEAIFYLMSEGALAGVSDFCDFPSRVNDLPRLGTAFTPDVKEIIKLGAQYVLSTSELPSQDVVELEQNGIRIIYLKSPSSLPEMRIFFSELCRLFYGETEGVKKSQLVDNQIDEIIERIRTKGGETVNALFVMTEQGDILTGDAPVWQLCESILGTKIVNLAAGYTGYALPADELSKLNPDIIYYAGGIAPEILAEIDGIKDMKALAEGRIREYDEVLLERFTVRSLEEYGKLLG